jgi:hypothetical protein
MTYIGMKTCPVVDHYHGGYLDTEMGDCDRCGGTGEVEDWEDEE